MKATKFSLFGLLALFLVFTACEDDFSEQDLLQLQAELAEQQAQNDFNRALQLLAQELANDIALAERNDEIQRAYMEFLNSLDSAQDEALRQRAIALLTQAGLITDYTVIMTSSDALVDGGVVSITNGTGTVSDTTDASGQVRFENVPVGTSTITVSAADHIGFSYRVDFGRAENNLETVTLDGQNVTVVEPNNAESTVRMLNTSVGSEVALISGKVEGETDLTNSEREALAGVPVIAELTNNLGGENEFDLVTGNSANNTLSIETIYFNEDSGFGADTTDADGMYTLRLPAERDLFLDYRLRFPDEISGTQRVAYVDGDSATIGDIATVWGVNATESAAPYVRGWQWNVSSPGALGTGFALGSVTAIGRGLIEDGVSAGEWETFLSSASLGERTDVGNNLSVIATRNAAGGGSFTATPTVSVTGGTTAPRIDVHLDWDFADVDVTAATNGRYNASDAGAVTVYLDVVGTANGTSDVDTIRYTLATIASDINGATAAQTINLDNFFTANRSDDNADGTTSITYTDGATNRNLSNAVVDIERDEDITITSFSVILVEGTVADNTQTAATATQQTGTTASLLSGDEFDVVSGGAGFTSAPTFAFTGFATGSAPEVVVNEWPVRYEFALDNSGASGYTYVPNIINFEYRDYVTDVNTTQTSSDDAVIALRQNTSDSTEILSTNTFADLLTISSGVFAAQNSLISTFATQLYLHGAPSLEALETTLDPIVPDYNSTAFSSNGEFNSSWRLTDAGSGYIAEPSIAVAVRTLMSTAVASLPTPGSTATPTLGTGFSFDVDERSKQYIFSGLNTFTNYDFDTDGEGYVYNINDQGTTGIGTVQFDYFNLEPNESFIRDIYYGYGERSTDIAGEPDVDIIVYQ